MFGLKIHLRSFETLDLTIGKATRTLSYEGVQKSYFMLAEAERTVLNTALEKCWISIRSISPMPTLHAAQSRCFYVVRATPAAAVLSGGSNPARRARVF